MTSHGYSTYTRGCRCEVCRAAKATYMRERRAEARRQAAWRSTRDAIHEPGRGSWVWYEEHGCRCAECVASRTRKRTTEQIRQQVREVNSRYSKRRGAA